MIQKWHVCSLISINKPKQLDICFWFSYKQRSNLCVYSANRLVSENVKEQRLEQECCYQFV